MTDLPAAPTLDMLATSLEALREEVGRLTLEAEARRVIGRYMFLCDVPFPTGDMAPAARAQAIASLFTEDAVWEGVGGAHGAQFGQHVGQSAIAAHFVRFYGKLDPKQVFNTHYLCTEQLRSVEGGAEGFWVQFQPWADDRGDSIVRSSRLHVRFRQTTENVKIAHYRTENLFIGDLPSRWWSHILETSQLQ